MFFIYYMNHFILYVHTYSGSTVFTSIRRGCCTPREFYGRTLSCCCVFGEVFLSPKKGKKMRERYMSNIYIYARYLHTHIPCSGRRGMVLFCSYSCFGIFSSPSFSLRSRSFLSLSWAHPFCHIRVYSFLCLLLPSWVVLKF